VLHAVTGRRLTGRRLTGRRLTVDDRLLRSYAAIIRQC
jgi:hypothetical protein